jgi:malonyl-CoA/methylmalonyl-CoA synthetase
MAAGDLRVGGPFLFKEYWGRPEATAAAFDEEGMFKTGDVVAFEGEPPYFKVRRSQQPARAAWQ